jgi:hypothetical protein
MNGQRFRLRWLALDLREGACSVVRIAPAPCQLWPKSTPVNGRLGRVAVDGANLRIVQYTVSVEGVDNFGPIARA